MKTIEIRQFDNGRYTVVSDGFFTDELDRIECLGCVSTIIASNKAPFLQSYESWYRWCLEYKAGNPEFTINENPTLIPMLAESIETALKDAD